MGNIATRIVPNKCIQGMSRDIEYPPLSKKLLLLTVSATKETRNGKIINEQPTIQ